MSKNKTSYLFPVVAIVAGIFLFKKKSESSVGYVSKRGQSSDFLSRRATAISDLYELQKNDEVKPMSYTTVERNVFYDKQRDSFRLIGKSYDYTARGI